MMQSVSRIDPGHILGLCFSEIDSIEGAQPFYLSWLRPINNASYLNSKNPFYRLTITHIVLFFANINLTVNYLNEEKASVHAC